MSDQLVLQAVRDCLAQQACNHGIENYCGGGQKISSDHSWLGRQFTMMKYVTHRLSDRMSEAKVRASVRRLAKAGHFTLRQSYRGAQISIQTTAEHTAQLNELSDKWWENIGYSKAEIRPRMVNHREPDSEAELLSAALST